LPLKGITLEKKNHTACPPGARDGGISQVSSDAIHAPYRKERLESSGGLFSDQHPDIKDFWSPMESQQSLESFSEGTYSHADGLARSENFPDVKKAGKKEGGNSFDSHAPSPYREGDLALTKRTLLSKKEKLSLYYRGRSGMGLPGGAAGEHCGPVPAGGSPFSPIWRFGGKKRRFFQKAKGSQKSSNSPRHSNYAENDRGSSRAKGVGSWQEGSRLSISSMRS